MAAAIGVDFKGKFAGEADQTLNQVRQILRLGTDMVRKRITHGPIVFPEKTAFIAKSHMNKARITNNNALKSQKRLEKDASTR